MKRRIGSYFYNRLEKTESVQEKRGVLSMLSRFVKKICMALGALVLFSICMGLISVFILRGTASLPDDMVLVFNVTHPVGETTLSPSLTSPFSASELTVDQIIGAMDKASRDSRVKGLLVSLDNADMELAHVQELRNAVKRFRNAGKFAHLYTASFADLGSGIGAYYFAAAFQEIWMQPVGMLSLTGISLEMPFAKKALDKIGVNPEFLHREEYKSAMESFTNESMSAPNREMLSSLLKSISGQIEKDISEDRDLEAKALEAAMQKGLLTGKDAVKAKLVTRMDYADALIDYAKGKAEEKPELVLIEDYYDAVHEEENPRARVALVRVSGEIVPGSEPEPGRATGDYIASAIHDAADSEEIKVIVLRVDSPGGSPSASETIRSAVVYAKEKGKKIIVSMGPVAASGGYWITVDADKIYALPGTLTGSIGVIMGKFEISRLWDKLGIKWEALTWGDKARLWSVNAPLSATERAAMDDAIDDTYAAFIDRVAKGRNMKPQEVRLIAKGRAWTGLQAKEIGLVDEIGGLDAAMGEAAKLAGYKSRYKMDVMELPKPLTPLEHLELMMRGQGIMASVFQGSGIAEQVAPVLEPFMAYERFGPVQAYDPVRLN
jgi:protease-4